jgi:hypothetical protein
MGLIALLISMTAIVRSQDDRTAALNKKETGTSLNAAEAGVTQVQEFLNRNRALANYNLSNWDSSSAFCGASTLTAINSLAAGGWQTIASSDAEIVKQNPKYRVKGYVTGANGELTVEGIVNSGTQKESVNEITVKFPIFSIEDKQAAALWATESITGSTQVQTDVYTSCDAETGSTGTVGDRIIVRSNSAIPASPATPGNAIDLDSKGGIKDKRLPLDGDAPSLNPDGVANSGDEVYYYKVSSIDGSFSIQDRKKVHLWVTGTGNIDLKNRNVFNECNVPVTLPVDSSGTTFTPSCGGFDVRIYGNPSASSAQLQLNEGTAVCDVHFHLPNYAATFTSGGTAPKDKDGNTLRCTPDDPTRTDDPIVRNTGIYWVKSWAGDTTLYPASNALWSSAQLDATTQSKLPPRLGPVENWKPPGDVSGTP